MSSTTRLGLIAVTALSAISLAACGSQGANSAPPASTPATSPPATSPAAAPPAATATPAPGSTSLAAAGTTPECGAGQLTVAYTDNKQIRGGALAGMSHVDNVVMFVNKGTSACWIRGYPGVAALNAAGQQIQQATRSAGAPDPLVVLKPGQRASSLITGNSASCTKLTTVHGLLVTPPNQRTSTRLGTYGALCLHSLGVQQVRRGDAGGLHL